MTERDALRDEIALRQRSLDDARAEHANGELDDDALAAIERREAPLLAAAEARWVTLEDETQTPAPVESAERPKGEPPNRSRLLLAGFVASVAVIAVVLTLAIADPFGSARAVPKLSPRARVIVLDAVAEIKLAQGHTLQSMTAFDAAARLDPHNAEAIVESAWLHYEYALKTHDPKGAASAAAALARTTRIVPNYAAAHLYDGIVLYQHDHNRTAALAQILRSAELPESLGEQSLTQEFLLVLQTPTH
jgi:hypothetical protein